MKRHALAFLISAVVHLGLLVMVLADVEPLPGEPVKEPRLSVRLQMSQSAPAAETAPAQKPEPRPEPEPAVAFEAEPVQVAPPPSPKAKPKSKPKPEPKPKPKPLPKVRSAEPVNSPPPTEKHTVATSLPLAPSVDSDLLRRLEDDYKAALRRAIEDHKRYPRQAVRLRREGEVVVGFTLRRDGVVEALRIVAGSGSRLLDKAALAAVEKISGRLPFPEALQRRQWDFTLPISYSLH